MGIDVDKRSTTVTVRTKEVGGRVLPERTSFEAASDSFGTGTARHGLERMRRPPMVGSSRTCRGMATGCLGPARIAAGQKEIQETREDVKSIQQRLESVESEVHEIHDLVQIPGAQ